MSRVDLAAWREQVLATPRDPAHWSAHVERARAQWLTAQRDDADAADRALAALWQQTDAGLHRNLIQPMAQGATLGPVAIDTLVQAVADAQARSANAALALLGQGEGLLAAHWRQLAGVARRERQKVLADIEVAQFIARYGPPEAGPTVLLTATRPGPEDAEDRRVAIAQLGRWAGTSWSAEAGQVVHQLALSGSCHLEVVYAEAGAMALGQWAAWGGGLRSVASAALGLDALARWTAIDGLCYANQVEGLQYVLAALASGGIELPPWYVPMLEARARTLDPQLTGKRALAAAVASVQPLPPLPDVAGRILSRDARVSRAACCEPGAPVAVMQERAGWEAAMVARDQLGGTLLPNVPAVQPPADFAPNWLPFAGAMHAAWQAAEARWLEPGRL